jgi:SAM-dependent methyltransferase/uncharacterized protein YbaR (Trm112 family)
MMQPMFLKNSDILACPLCGGSLGVADESLACENCKVVHPVVDGVPMLFASSDVQGKGVTETVKSFYEEHPFPNYDELDSEEALIEKARRGIFARLLDEQIPQGACVLEIGCGTGQLTNFLGMYWNRRVFGSDICLNSLRLANVFRERCGIKNAGFLQMNLFRPAFRKDVFDLVISNGVLHHTADPLGAFRSISRLVKPGGFIIIGLYNKMARLTTDFRRMLFRLSGDRLRFLDSHMRNKQYDQARKRAWFMDQYKHPQESKHSYDEVIDWFESNDFEFSFSIPKIAPGPFSPDEQLFVPHDKGTKFARFLTQLEMLLQGGVDGGLFIMIGRKVQQSLATQVLGRGRTATATRSGSSLL